MQEIGKRNIISHSNKLTEARYSLSVAEQRLVITLLSLISPDDEELKDYDIKISEFKKLLGIKTNTFHEQIKDVLRKIAGRVLHIPTENGYIITHWFSSAEYNSKKGSVQISLDKKLQPYLLQLKEQFTKYRLFIITQFQSAYTVRIYMLLKQYERIGYREIDVSELRYMLDIEEKKYPLFKDFRKWVLNQAKKEFEAKDKNSGGYNSDITFDLETIRTGRKITRLKFIIKKQTYQETLPIELPEPEEKAPALQALEKHGIEKNLAELFINEQSEESILRCVSLYEEAIQEGKVKKQNGGYLLAMLKAEAGKITEAEKEKAVKKEEENKKKQAKQQEKENENLKNELAKEFRKKEVKNYLSSLSEKQKIALLKEIKKEYSYLNITDEKLESPTLAAFYVSTIPDFEKNQKTYIEKHIKRVLK